VRSALETVKENPSDPAPIDPREVLLSLLTPAGTAPMAIEEIYRAAASRGIGQEVAQAVLQELLAEGECYSPRNGYIRLL
jgi:DNA replicative helicase MCM subunit Mcm2 (Cdc46/Mcm family)